jgi:hypothetical protein
MRLRPTLHLMQVSSMRQPREWQRMLWWQQLALQWWLRS